MIRGNKTMEAQINKFVPKKNQRFVAYYESAFKLLLNDRVDVVVGKPIVGKKYLSMNKNLATSGKFQYQDVFIYLHKKHKDLIPMLEKEIRQMRLSGELKEIEEKVRKEF